MKIEKEIREIIESEMKKYDYWEVNEKENARILAPALVGLFKSYARSLVPERKNYDNDDIKNPEFTEICAYKDGWNECREEMLRRIEEDRR